MEDNYRKKALGHLDEIREGTLPLETADVLCRTGHHIVWDKSVELKAKKAGMLEEEMTETMKAMKSATE